MRTCYFIFFAFVFYSCSNASEPQQIIEQWQLCQEKSELDDKCIKIGHQALELKTMVETLEFNPQGFGLEIMNLQNQLNNSEISSDEKNEITKKLNFRLSLVGWLESPK